MEALKTKRSMQKQQERNERERGFQGERTYNELKEREEENEQMKMKEDNARGKGETS